MRAVRKYACAFAHTVIGCSQVVRYRAFSILQRSHYGLFTFYGVMWIANYIVALKVFDNAYKACS